MIRARSGFTLIEVLLASSLTVVVGLGVASLLGTMRKADERVRVRSARRALLSAIERRIVADIRSLIPPGGLYAAGLVGEDQVGGSGATEELLPAELAELAGKMTTPDGEPAPLDQRDQLKMAVLPPARPFGQETPAGEGAIWDVVYKVDDDPETEERGLVRQITRVRNPATGSDPEPVEELAKEVVAINLGFFDGQEWQETWDSSASDTLPLGVRVDLVIAMQGEVFVYRIFAAPPAGRPSQLIEASR